MARPNREILTGGKRYRDSKKSKHRVDEVTFDKEKRKDYLTGFHKRKLERKKKAQIYLEEQAKKDRLEERARIREERKLQVQKKLSEMKEALELNPFLDNEDSDDSDDDQDYQSNKNDEDGEDDDDEEEEDDDDEEDEESADNRVKFDSDIEKSEEWNGFDNGDGASSSKKRANKKGILKKQIFVIENDDAPVSGTSEVVIETLDNPNSINFDTLSKKMNVDMTKATDVLNNSIVRAKKYARLMGMTDAVEENDKVSKTKPKQKKKKFRYLSKTERKVKNLKERMSSQKRKKRE